MFKKIVVITYYLIDSASGSFYKISLKSVILPNIFFSITISFRLFIFWNYNILKFFFISLKSNKNKQLFFFSLLLFSSTLWRSRLFCWFFCLFFVIFFLLFFCSCSCRFFLSIFFFLFLFFLLLLFFFFFIYLLFLWWSRNRLLFL